MGVVRGYRGYEGMYRHQGFPKLELLLVILVKGLEFFRCYIWVPLFMETSRDIFPSVVTS